MFLWIDNIYVEFYGIHIYHNTNRYVCKNTFVFIYHRFLESKKSRSESRGLVFSRFKTSQLVKWIQRLDDYVL